MGKHVEIFTNHESLQRDVNEFLMKLLEEQGIRDDDIKLHFSEAKKLDGVMKRSYSARVEYRFFDRHDLGRSE